jgi:ornithine--oxo-acid transaminase
VSLPQACANEPVADSPKAFFCSSGSEGVETVIKFVRAHTGRTSLLSARSSFHGLTCGALSLMSDGFWKDGFGPMLPDIEQVTFGDIEELSAKLSSQLFRAFIVEPIQVEGGLRIPNCEYMQRAQERCRRHGTLFVLDKVQTASYRTGYRFSPPIISTLRRIWSSLPRRSAAG